MKLPKIVTASLSLAFLIPALASAEDWKEGMKVGSPDFKSMGPLTFGPEGILFVGDAKNAAITAIATGDTETPSETPTLRVEAINEKIAALVGASADQILIDDMAVNPISRNVYLAVSRGRGPDAIPVLARVNASNKIELVSLEKVPFSRATLPDAPADEIRGQGRRQSNPRLESITDLAFLEDRVLVAGLSNEEFASTLRAVPFPFENIGQGTSVEIYHGAHGRFETRSPVRTFVPFNIGDQPHLLAAYTCTPLVQFPVKNLAPGAKIKGKTIAELGNRNRPIDMIVYNKDGKDYLLLANNNRGIMKISTDEIEIGDGKGIEERVEGGGTDGLAYETIEAWKGVAQLDRLDGGHAVVVKAGEGETVDLESRELP